MSYRVQGIVALEKDAPVSQETIIVPDPGPGEVIVSPQACGVCHTDLHYRQGNITDDFPFLLGHEAAGIVEAVGEAVSNVAVGDYVILNWRAVCGGCRACERGRPWYCFATHNATQNRFWRHPHCQLQIGRSCGAHPGTDRWPRRRRSH